MALLLLPAHRPEVAPGQAEMLGPPDGTSPIDRDSNPDEADRFVKIDRAAVEG
jgi:hypothetical protein